MQKPWIAAYQAGVPAEINPDSYRSLIEIYDETIQRYGNRIAFKNYGVNLTYRALDEHSKRLAAYFQTVWGLVPGDRIGLMMPNILQYPVTLFAAIRAGLVVVNINPQYTAAELKHLIQDSQASALIVVENFAHVAQSVVQDTSLKHIAVARVGDLLGLKGCFMNCMLRYVKKVIPPYELPGAIPFKSMLRCAPSAFTPVVREPNDIALLQYTSATTGAAKGAILTHRNLVANVLQGSAWISSMHFEEELDGAIVTALPLYHIFSFTANCLIFFRLGFKNLLITNPRDIQGFINTLKKEPFSAMTGANTLFNALLKNPGFAQLNFGRFRITLGGGMAVQSAVAARWKEVTGVPLLEAYGLTEASPAVCINPLYCTEFNGTVGLPIPSTEIRLVNLEGNPVGVGEQGELWVRGPQVMRGYWNKPEETRKVITEDGWLRTGDIAKMDAQGFISIVDRIKDMIIVSGFKVYPNEIEDVLAQCPGVHESAVVGAPYELTGERVIAFVVLRDPSVTKGDIIAHCRKSLTSYKVPKEIVFKEDLPKNNVGKVLRRMLRDEAQKSVR
ncbi:MAG: AMP-binding protein [Pseudomonadota bacterium]